MKIKTRGLHPLLAAIVKVLPRFAAAYGVSINFTSAVRSRAEQERLYALYKAGKMPYVVALPGTSRHERGLALDITTNNLKWLVDTLTGVGLRWAGMKDPVHFEIP